MTLDEVHRYVRQGSTVVHARARTGFRNLYREVHINVIRTMPKNHNDNLDYWKPYLFHGQPIWIHRLLVLERSHKSLYDVTNVEHAHGRTADSVHGRVEHAVHDRIGDAGQSGVHYVTCTLWKTRNKQNVYNFSKNIITVYT